jgi:hypothetical protein
MKLEYLAEGSPDCPLIRLYDFDRAEAERLLAALMDLASGTAERVDVHALPGVESLNGCRLTLVSCRRDRGISRTGSLRKFEYTLTPGTWDNVAGLVEPFARGEAGYQWLNQVPADEIALLLSVNGLW